MRPRGSGGVRSSDGLCNAGMPSSSSLRENGGVLRAQGQVLQDQPAQALPAQILPQESALSGSGRSGLRNARAL
jgi:hypothetical protein